MSHPYLQENAHTHSPQTSKRSATLATRGRGRTLVVATATLAALGTWIVAAPVMGIELLVTPGGSAPQSVGVASVILAAVLASVLGWAALALLERFATHPQRLWTVLASAILLFSLAGPLGAGATQASQIALSAMHVVVGAVLIVGLRHTSSASRSEDQ
ncbi:MAG: DUF6069 family protein [Arachnia sp.]